MTKGSGLDGRSRNENGRTRATNGTKLIGTIEKQYGIKIPARTDMKLDTALEKFDVPSEKKLIEKFS